MTNKLLSGRHILVVEDEMLVLMIIEDMLADVGCESVTAAATVAQALALIDAQVFDAAMLDVNLNGAASYPLADALDAHGVPFFFSTGYSAQGIKESYRNRLVLKKPFQLNDLVEILTRLCLPDRATVLISNESRTPCRTEHHRAGERRELRDPLG